MRDAQIRKVSHLRSTTVLLIALFLRETHETHQWPHIGSVPSSQQIGRDLETVLSIQTNAVLSASLALWCDARQSARKNWSAGCLSQRSRSSSRTVSPCLILRPWKPNLRVFTVRFSRISPDYLLGRLLSLHFSSLFISIEAHKCLVLDWLAKGMGLSR